MKTMIVGLDGSERGPHVLRAALEMAESRDARLVVIRAVGIPVEFSLASFSTSPEALPGILLGSARSDLDRMVKASRGESKFRIDTVEVRLGTPWQVLCDAATRLSAELLIVGSHGYGTLDMLLGTTAARVVNHAPCSVLVVRDAAR